MGIKELSKTFGISESNIVVLCRTKGSPAYKTGEGKKARWMCFPSDFKKWRIEQAEKWKG